MSNRKFQDIIFTDCNPKTTTEKIGEFEKAIGLSLPADYREFLLAVNGGISTVRGFHCLSDPEPAVGAGYDPNWAETLKKYWSSEKVQINDDLLRNTYQPRIITQFFGLDAPKGECIQYYCKRAKAILDTPDVRSLIPIGYSNHFRGDNFVGGDISLSLSQSHFGYVYFGNVESKAMRSYMPGYLGPKKLQTLPLQDMESSLVARSFAEFLSLLFPVKTIIHEEYDLPKNFQKQFKDYEDTPNRDYVLEAAEQVGDSDLPFPVSSEKITWIREGHTLTGTIRLSAWCGLIDDEKAEVKVTINTKATVIPENIEQAIQHTIANQEKLKKVIVKAIMKEIKETVKEDEDAFPELEDIHTAADLEGNLSLSEISIVPPPSNEPVRVGYSFDCEWHDEHGYAFILCGDKIVDSGMAEILDCPYGQ